MNRKIWTELYIVSSRTEKYKNREKFLSLKNKLKSKCAKDALTKIAKPRTLILEITYIGFTDEETSEDDENIFIDEGVCLSEKSIDDGRTLVHLNLSFEEARNLAKLITEKLGT